MADKKEKTVKKKFNVMFVCTGNTCRSPMAEFMFKAYLKDKKRGGDFSVSSAGLYAERNTKLTEEAHRALDVLGVEHNPERKAKVFTVQMSKDADLVVTMTAEQARACGDNAVSFDAITGRPVVDPFGAPLGVYLDTATQIRSAFDAILSLCDERRAKSTISDNN